jgi:two-component system OmpR family sensor kinase
LQIKSTKNIKIDSHKLSKLFDNNLINAIKYSNPNSKIEIIVKNDGFIVKDYGIGIKKDKIKEIFTRYKRATTQGGGFGIGLSVVKKITQEYGFDIKIDSSYQKGTKVSVKWQN